jgi:putative Mg2+ transporter-C (MgtC) family protein
VVIQLWMLANMLVALLLGWTVGYERYFKGRAAGSQVYCLVCVTSCAVTLLVGSGFVVAAAGLAALFVACTAVIPWLEHHLPARSPIVVTLRFREGYKPQPDEIHRFLVRRGLSIPPGSLVVSYEAGRFELECTAMGESVVTPEAIGRIAAELNDVPDVEGFTVAPSTSA